MKKSFIFSFLITLFLVLFFGYLKCVFIIYVILGYGHFLLSYMYLTKSFKSFLITLLFMCVQLIIYLSNISTEHIILFSASVFYLHFCFNEYEISKNLRSLSFVTTLALSIIGYIYVVLVYILGSKESSIFSLENIIGLTIILHILRWYFYLIFDKKYYIRNSRFIYNIFIINILFFVLYFILVSIPEKSTLYQSLDSLFSARFYYIAAVMHIFYTSSPVKNFLV